MKILKLFYSLSTFLKATRHLRQILRRGMEVCAPVGKDKMACLNVDEGLGVTGCFGTLQIVDSIHRVVMDEEKLAIVIDSSIFSNHD